MVENTGPKIAILRNRLGGGPNVHEIVWNFAYVIFLWFHSKKKLGTRKLKNFSKTEHPKNDARIDEKQIFPSLMIINIHIQFASKLIPIPIQQIKFRHIWNMNAMPIPIWFTCVNIPGWKINRLSGQPSKFSSLDLEKAE